MVLSENPTIEELQSVVHDYPDLEVTRNDSIAVGNCESGTDDFLDVYFKGRTSVKMSELAPHIADFYGVRLAIIHVVRQHEAQPEG